MWIRPQIDYSFDQLHRLPTFLCLLALGSLYLVTFIMMQYYVFHYHHSFIIFCVGSLLTYCSYFVMHFYLEKYSASYSKIPSDRKFYVLSNLIKSGFLSIFTPHALYMLLKLNSLPSVIIPTKLPNQSYSLFFFNYNTSLVTTLHNMCVLYAIPDFVSMLLVEKMAMSTKIHHIVVVMFAFINLYQDFTTPSVWIGVVVYGIYSSFSYLVNFLLASRFFQMENQLDLFVIFQMLLRA